MLKTVSDLSLIPFVMSMSHCERQCNQCSEQPLLESSSVVSKAPAGLAERLTSALAVCVSAPMMVGLMFAHHAECRSGNGF